jgi:molybdopterin-guanine dinucleotide biosynthesis protein A
MSNISGKNKSLAFVILIGGKSKRFGSDKGLYKFNGKPLIMYQLEILSRFNHSIFVVAHSQKQMQEYVNEIDFRKITAFILDDHNLSQDKNIRSPMIGIYSAFKELDKLGYDKAFTISCDMPLIKYEIIEFLIKKAEDYDFCIPKWDNGYLEPLFAIYPIKKTLFKIKVNLKNKTYKLLNIIDKNWKSNYISVEKELQSLDADLLNFININNHVDIENLMQIEQNKNSKNPRNA